MSKDDEPIDDIDRDPALEQYLATRCDEVGKKIEIEEEAEQPRKIGKVESKKKLKKDKADEPVCLCSMHGISDQAHVKVVELSGETTEKTAIKIAKILAREFNCRIYITRIGTQRNLIIPPPPK